nr:immunoglobulin heavy chain junction region [Macaca mulatta]MOV41516.1 immunoglobulin heavy chain junction region [Macaca mulatta]MOV42499.1 immunoglobulin heavy chain junction region [Macaca mulatta]MOV42557.1 immunoglobulin heavy chain junction region [Macaca mulatta]MOV42858.1 immunoglobulin heavy chain junction region [Macaca mulatta]
CVKGGDLYGLNPRGEYFGFW